MKTKLSTRHAVSPDLVLDQSPSKLRVQIRDITNLRPSDIINDEIDKHSQQNDVEWLIYCDIVYVDCTN